MLIDNSSLIFNKKTNLPSLDDYKKIKDNIKIKYDESIDNYTILNN